MTTRRITETEVTSRRSSVRTLPIITWASSTMLRPILIVGVAAEFAVEAEAEVAEFSGSTWESN